MTITRTKSGTGFSYYEKGALVTNKETKEWIASLSIPPAWTEVTISKNVRAKVLAKGKDDSGRQQAIYNPKFRAKQEKLKYTKILDFAQALPALRQQIAKDLHKPELDKHKVLACIVKLIDEAYFRVGNEQYAKENHSYGITTMRSKHVDVTGYTVTFDFIGKSGKQHTKKVTNQTIAKIIKQLDEMPGYEIFRYQDEKGSMHNITATDVNQYIKDHMGEAFSAKDFRTWGGTLHAIEVLAAEELCETDKERSKTVTMCVERVATRLGNTPAIARSSYIDPQVFTSYMGGQDFKKARRAIENMKPDKYLSADERCALRILQAIR